MTSKSLANTPTPTALRRFRREDGAVTVAAALWVPFLVFVLTVLADASTIFYGQARALQVAQDANRALSVGTLQSSDEAQTYITNALSGISPNVSSQTSSDDGVLTTIVTLPASDLVAVGFMTSLTSFQMRVVSQMVQEF